MILKKTQNNNNQNKNNFNPFSLNGKTKILNLDISLNEYEQN